MSKNFTVMKKAALFLPLCLVLPVILTAQAYEGSIEFEKKKQRAVVIDYTFPPEAVENALVQKMEKLGYKGKEEKGLFNKDKGFRVYKSAFISEISESSMDYILKVEQRSRRAKDESTVYLVIRKNGENAMDGFEATEMTRAKDFLNNLLPDVEAANLELQIRDQEELVTKTEKKLSGLKDDKKNMEEKVRKLQDDIRDNEKEQSRTVEEIENHRKALEQLKGRRVVKE